MKIKKKLKVTYPLGHKESSKNESLGGKGKNLQTLMLEHRATFFSSQAA